MSATFSDVDASSDPAGAADGQDRVDSWPAVVAYKAMTYELLRVATGFGMWAPDRGTIPVPSARREASG